MRITKITRVLQVIPMTTSIGGEYISKIADTFRYVEDSNSLLLVSLNLATPSCDCKCLENTEPLAVSGWSVVFNPWSLIF